MSFVPFVVLLSSPEAIAIAEKLGAKHAKMTTATIYVWDGLSPAMPTKLRLKPDVCTVAMPNQQIVEMRSNYVRFFDEIFNQVAGTKPGKPLKIPDSAPSVAIIHREPMAWLLDAKQRGTFFTEIRRDPRWQVKGNSLVLADGPKKVKSEVFFDTSFRVTEIRFTMNNKIITDWRYRYVSDKDVPAIPATAKNVKGLPSRPNLPATTKGQAVAVAQKLWRSVSRLDGRTIIQANESGTFELSLSSGKMTEIGPKGSWTLNGLTLTVKPTKGTAKTLAGTPGKFLDGLRSTGIEASPFAWYFLNRKVPYLDLFDQSDVIELEGQGSFGGKTLAILSIKRRNNRIRLYIEPKSGDLNMLSSDALDASGSVISSSRMKVTYR